ncbi:putative metalloprotease CJM1_0395 family protein [Paenisporosarcina cavernae]|nr:putative metalloprotease CJM1_0395 family protein [Paenisporosarcina cavernae]
MSMRLAAEQSVQDRSVQQEFRKRLIQRKDATNSYKKQAELFQTKKPSLQDLEDLLLGKKEQEQQPHTLKFGTTPVHAIAGNNLEETIDLLEQVKEAALASVEPSDQDLRVAATASNRISQVRAQLSLHELANSRIKEESFTQEQLRASVTNRSSLVDFQDNKDANSQREQLARMRLFEKARQSYDYQVQLKQAGFQVKEPSFYRIA